MYQLYNRGSFSKVCINFLPGGLGAHMKSVETINSQSKFPSQAQLQSIDYQTLGKLLGINFNQLKSSEQQPKWRKLEVLNELKQLESDVNDFNIN
jgi:hypothetical protein